MNRTSYSPQTTLRFRNDRFRPTSSLYTSPVDQGLLVFWNSDQFKRFMHLDGMVAKCGRNILPSVHPQQIQDGITDTSQYLRSQSLANAARILAVKPKHGKRSGGFL